MGVTAPYDYCLWSHQMTIKISYKKFKLYFKISLKDIIGFFLNGDI